MIDKLNPEQIEELIHQQVFGRLGCCENGTTYIVPLSYAYDGNYIYCRAFEGKKLAIMRKHPLVCFQIDNIKNLAEWKSVIAWGNFEELDSQSEAHSQALIILQNRILPILSSETMHLSPNWPFPSSDPNEIPGIIFRIRLLEKTGMYETAGNQYFFAT